MHGHTVPHDPYKYEPKTFTIQDAVQKKKKKKVSQLENMKRHEEIWPSQNKHPVVKIKRRKEEQLASV